MSVLERVHIIDVFFLKRIYENFVGTLETARNTEVSVLERRIANLCRFCGSSRLQLINFINISFVQIIGTVTSTPENLGAAISVKKAKR